MSSYFSAINNNEVTTIDDNNQTLGVCREGIVRANILNGEIFGVALSAGESVTFRPEGDTKLICSPPVVFGGGLVYFVATTSSVSVRYRVYKKVSLEKYAQHGNGLVLFDEQKNIVFDSSVRTWRHKGFYQSNFLFHYGELSAWTVNFYIALSHASIWMPNDPGNFNEDAMGNEPMTISLSGESYVNPLNSPWVTWFTPDGLRDRPDHRFSTLGYVFKGNTLTTERYFDRWYFPQKILGSGTVSCLSDVRGVPLMTGIMSGSYMFNIVE